MFIVFLQLVPSIALRTKRIGFQTSLLVACWALDFQQTLDVYRLLLLLSVICLNWNSPTSVFGLRRLSYISCSHNLKDLRLSTVEYRRGFDPISKTEQVPIKMSFGKAKESIDIKLQRVWYFCRYCHSETWPID